MLNDNEELKRVVYDSPWRNAYWHTRNLLNTDKYGALGKDEKLMRNILLETKAILIQPLSDEDKLKVCLSITKDKIRGSARQNTKAQELRDNFIEYLEDEIDTIQDFIVFLITIEYIVLPTNAAINNIPSDDLVFCRTTAENILDSLGRKKVAAVLSTWDNMGVAGCLNAERLEVIGAFTRLRATLNTLEYGRSEIEDNAILTAFVQEFERRAGQKRKSRAGGSLEDVATFLFNYYGFRSHPKPDHFQTDIEVDKWFKCVDGWSIGISCKRTLRERWKQVSSADGHALSRYRISEIWHLLTYDRDLSDDKIVMLGQQRQIFYLKDDSPRYVSAKNHIGMKDYVRPLSQLIDDIAERQGVELRKNQIKILYCFVRQER